MPFFLIAFALVPRLVVALAIDLTPARRYRRRRA